MPAIPTLDDLVDDLTGFTLARQEILGARRVRPDADERAERDEGDRTRILVIELADGRVVRAWLDEELHFGEDEEGAAWLQPSDGSKPLRLWAPEDVRSEAGL